MAYIPKIGDKVWRNGYLIEVVHADDDSVFGTIIDDSYSSNQIGQSITVPLDDVIPDNTTKE